MDQDQQTQVDRRINTDSRLAEMEDRLLVRIDDRFEELKKIFMQAFPDGDPHGHRIAHEEVIRSSERWLKIKFGVLEKTASGGVWAAILFIAMLVWEHIKRDVKQ